MDFLEPAIVLFQAHSHDVNQARRKRATLFFLCFTALCVLFSFNSSFLLLHLHTVLSLNHTISLLAIVLCRALGRDVDEAHGHHSFTFGLRRLSVLLRFAGAVFVIFGALTTVAEATHVALHDEPVNLLLASTAALLHAIFLLVYRTDVLDADLVVGFGWRSTIRSVYSRPQLHQQMLFGAAPALGSGDDVAALQPAAWAQSGGPSGLPRVLWQRVAYRLWGGVQRTANTLRLLLLPLCSMLCCAGSAVTAASHLDVWVGLCLAVYYLAVGLREGRCMAWHLLNNSAQNDPTLRRLITNTLQKIELMDGVMQVKTNLWWAASPDQLVAMLRVRLMAGADPVLVTTAVRRALRRVAALAFVECLPAASTTAQGLPQADEEDEADIDGGGRVVQHCGCGHASQHSHARPCDVIAAAHHDTPACKEAARVPGHAWGRPVSTSSNTAFPGPVTGVFASTSDDAAAVVRDNGTGVTSAHFPPPPLTVQLGSRSII